MKLQDVFRVVPGGSAVSGSTVKLYRHSDNSEITLSPAVTTDANGLFGITLDMNPGPVYWEATDGFTTRRGSTKAYGMAGPIPLYELVYVLQSLGNAVVDGSLNEFAVTAAASGLKVNVNSGAALVKGIVAVSYSSQELTFNDADSNNARIDTVVIEVTQAGQAEEGKSLLKVVKGTPASSPTAPALTQTAATWQYPLADVRIEATATSLTSNKITDRRTYLLTGGELTRNPTVMGLGNHNSTSNTTISSTSGQNITQLTTSVTLLNGVTYDIVARGWLLVQGTSTDIGLRAYINGTSNAGTELTTAATSSFVGLSVIHAATITGTGASISCGLLARKLVSAGSGAYRSGHLVVQAIPRS